MANVSRATREIEELKVRREVVLKRERAEVKMKLIMDELGDLAFVSKDWLKNTIMNRLGISDRHIVNSWIKQLEYTGRIIETKKNHYKIDK